MFSSPVHLRFVLHSAFFEGDVDSDMTQIRNGQKTKSVKRTAHVGTFLDTLAGSLALSWQACLLPPLRTGMYDVSPVGATVAPVGFAGFDGAPQLGHANALELIL